MMDRMLVDPYPLIFIHYCVSVNRYWIDPLQALLCTIFIRIPFLDSSYASLHMQPSELKLKWISLLPFLAWYPDKTVSTDWTL